MNRFHGGNVVVDEDAVRHLIDDPEGPAGRYLDGMAENVLLAMKELIDTSVGGHPYETFIYTPRSHVRKRTLYMPRGWPEDRELPHMASVPGEAPANWTGGLKESLFQTEVQQAHDAGGRFGSGLEVRVGSDDKVASYMEHGTFNIEPRPFMGPGLDIGMRMPVIT